MKKKSRTTNCYSNKIPKSNCKWGCFVAFEGFASYVSQSTFHRLNCKRLNKKFFFLRLRVCKMSASEICIKQHFIINLDCYSAVNIIIVQLHWLNAATYTFIACLKKIKTFIVNSSITIFQTLSNVSRRIGNDKNGQKKTKLVNDSFMLFWRNY